MLRIGKLFQGALTLAFFLVMALVFLAFPAGPVFASEVITIVSENFDAIFTVVGIILGIVSPVAAGYWQRSRKLARELVEVMDAEPKVSNRDFKKRAENLGNKAAAKAIAQIT